jgi:hypothetical protein
MTASGNHIWPFTKQVWLQAWNMVCQQWILLTIAIVLMTLPSILGRFYLTDADAVRLGGLIAVISLIPQIMLVERALSEAGQIHWSPDVRRGFLPRAFGQSFFASIAIICGSLLLIVPGFILLIRWSLSIPAMISHDLGITEGLQRSWELTAGRFWQIAVAWLIAWGPVLVSLTIIFFPISAQAGLLEIILIETSFSLSIVGVWMIQTAIYCHVAATPNS